jgi:hypothetical protein
LTVPDRYTDRVVEVRISARIIAADPGSTGSLSWGIRQKSVET